MMMHRFASACALAGLVALASGCAAVTDAPQGTDSDDATAEENLGVTTQGLTAADAAAGQRAATFILQKIMRPTEPLPSIWLATCGELHRLVGSTRDALWNQGALVKITRAPNRVIEGRQAQVVRVYYYFGTIGFGTIGSWPQVASAAAQCYGDRVKPFFIVSEQRYPSGGGTVSWVELDPEVATLTSTLSTTWGAKASAKSVNDGSATYGWRAPSSWSTLSSLQGALAGEPCSPTSATLYSGATLTDIVTAYGTKRKCVPAPSSGETQMVP